MIYDRIDFHNAAELVSGKRGFALNRLPGDVRKQLNEGARTGASYHCSGVELRFRIRSGEVDLYMRTEDATEALPALIYYGSFQGGWECSARAIGEKMSRLHIRPAQNLPVLQNRCPVDKHTKREEIKQLVYDLSATYPDLRERIFGAMQRYPLPEWEPKGRYKRPKYEE